MRSVVAATVSFLALAVPASLASAQTPRVQQSASAGWGDEQVLSTGSGPVDLKHSADGGRTWGRDQRMTRTAGESTKPSLAVSRDFLHLIWIDTRDGSPKLYYRRASRPVAD